MKPIDVRRYPVSLFDGVAVAGAPLIVPFNFCGKGVRWLCR